MLKRTIFSYIVPVAAVAAFIGGGVGLAGRIPALLTEMDMS